MSIGLCVCVCIHFAFFWAFSVGRMGILWVPKCLVASIRGAASIRRPTVAPTRIEKRNLCGWHRGHVVCSLRFYPFWILFAPGRCWNSPVRPAGLLRTLWLLYFWLLMCRKLIIKGSPSGRRDNCACVCMCVCLVFFLPIYATCMSHFLRTPVARFSGQFFFILLFALDFLPVSFAFWSWPCVIFTFFFFVLVFLFTTGKYWPALIVVFPLVNYWTEGNEWWLRVKDQGGTFTIRYFHYLSLKRCSVIWHFLTIGN